MHRTDRLFSGLWILFGLGECVQAWMLGLGTISEPEGGFMPFVVGAVIILLAGCLFFEVSFLSREKTDSKVDLWSGVHWKRVVLVILFLSAYALLLPKLGFLVATFLLMVFLLRSGDPIKWPATLLAGVLTSGLSYLIFGTWLRVSFPSGIFSF